MQREKHRAMAKNTGKDPGDEGDEPSVYDTYPPAEADGDGAATPAPQQQRQQQAQPPATQQQSEQIEQGLALGDMLSKAGSDDPHESAQAQGEFLQLAGAAAARLGQNVIENANQHQQRAEQARQQGAFHEATARPCINCGKDIPDPPEGEAFLCPHCETPLLLPGGE